MLIYICVCHLPSCRIQIHIPTYIHKDLWGHVTDADVASLWVSLADKVGNDGADERACLGADSHAIDLAIASAARLQSCGAQRLQRMMVEMLAARAKGMKLRFPAAR